MSHGATILTVAGLRIRFGDFLAVNKLSFSITAGSTLAIVGESGSGKSLTALALMGLLPGKAKLSGDMVLRGRNRIYKLHDLDATAWQRVRGRKTGMIFQEPMSALNPVMKAGKQLQESILAHKDISKAAAKAQAIAWLGKVQLPDPEAIYHRYPHQLSGGQKQRLMIAMAMCQHPALLIADEPTTALDVTVQKEIITLMQQLQQEYGTAMIFITHDLSLAASIASQVMVMYRGEMVEYGNTAQVLLQPQHAYTRALLACKPSGSNKGSHLPVVADFLEGKAAATPVPQPKPATIEEEDTNILEVNQLKIWFPSAHHLWGATTQYYKAVDDVSFVIKKAETLGLVGESGCGKSTLSRSLMGLLPVHEGQILFNGQDLSRINEQAWKQVRRDIQMVFQDPFSSLNPRMTVGDIIGELLQVHHIVPRQEIKAEVQRLLQLVQLPAAAVKKYPHEFSGGQRQRIGIARALALQPRLLICDESVSALDVSIQAQILNLLKDLQHELQLTYLFISHDLNVVHYFCDRIIVMQQGHFVEEGEADAIRLHPQNAYTQKLIAAIP